MLSPILARKKTLAEEIAALDIAAMICPVFPKKETTKPRRQFHYEGVDIITLKKLVERDYTIPEPQTAEEVISYYAKRIAQDVKLPSQFAALVPKVREFLATKAFGERVDLADKTIIKAIATSVAQYVTVKTFAKALRGLVVEELTPVNGDARRAVGALSRSRSRAPRSRRSKTVFNLVAADNEFEREFAHFLQDATDVRAFAKLPGGSASLSSTPTARPTSATTSPTSWPSTCDGDHHLIETKGREDIDVVHKDRAATIWCENATLLTGFAGTTSRCRRSSSASCKPATWQTSESPSASTNDQEHYREVRA